MNLNIEEHEIQLEVNRLKNLVTLRNKPEDYIRTKAIEIIRKKKVDIDIEGMFPKDKAGQKRATTLLFRYLDDFSIESISDKNTLSQLIYLEIIQTRLQEKLNEHYEENKKAVPIAMVDVIHKNADAILKLKEELGLGKGKGESGYDALKHLKLRFNKWLLENQASRSLRCPNCAEMILLKIKTDIWEAQKHPFFKDKVLYNKHLMKLYKQKIITRDDVAKVLECSPNYADWVISKVEKETNEESEESGQ